MIIYFADRKMNILGLASTGLMDGLAIAEDVKTEELETGVATFSCRIPFSAKNRDKVERCTSAGNYILRSNDRENEFYTIIETEVDTESEDVYLYAEDAGLDLLNEVALVYSADQAYTLAYYVEKWINDSGFEIGINEAGGATKKLAWDSESTVTERLRDIATQFGDYEISYSFAIEGLAVTHKYVNIYKKRGKDIGMQLRLNQDINQIVTKKSIANLATALLCVGAEIESTSIPQTLEGYAYDDGDFYVDGKYLKSRNAVAKWSRYVWDEEPNRLAGYNGHIIKTFSYDTVNQKELCEQAVTELKKVCDIEANYEVDIAKLPENAKIGDTVNIVDDAGALYLSARILKLETSVSNKKRTATLGDYLIKDSGISQKVEELAAQFAEMAKARQFYTWVAYADDQAGSGISLDPTGKEYLGTATNKLTESVNIGDPTIFTWVRIKGEKGEKGDPGIGVPGADGISALSITEQYYLSTSSVEQAGGIWDTVIPEWESGHYIWKRQEITWSDGATTYTDPVLDTAINHAGEAAEYAKAQATEAQTAANAAQMSATEAEAAAQTAAEDAASTKGLAQTAVNDAASAKTEAAAAKKAADEATSEVTLINKEITGIKADAVEIRGELAAEVETIAETLETSYTKKTELTETEASLKSEISKSVAELQSTMTSDFAKKTDLAEVESDLQTQVTQNANSISSTATAVEKVQADVTNAQAAATSAQTAAAAAQSTADSAQLAATTAQTAAESAATAAQTAQTKANAAQTAADSAKTAASNADAAAKAAQKDLDTAKANLVAVTSRVDATEEDIAAAQEAVETAQAAADKAKSDAASANSAAAAAQSTANTAKANAATAQTAANNAKTAADNAKAAADAAQKAADTAQAGVDNLAPRVTTAETKIEQNAEAIALRATKTEVSDLETRMSSAEQKITPSAIINTVSGTYATKAENKAAVDAAAAAQASVDGLEIGGRNLLKPLCSTGGQTANVGDYSIETTGVNADTYFYINLYETPQEGQEYTFSYEVDYDGELNSTNWAFGVTGTASGIKLPIQKGKQSVTFVFSNTTKTKYILDDIGTRDTSGTIVKIFNLKLEKGNKATDWSPAPEDTEASISAVNTIATQTADKFNWIVKSGTSATDFTLTDRVAELTAQQINLNGLVQFSGLDSAAQNQITTAASTANTALSTANSASSAAATAQSTANTAKSNAEAAQSTADSASNVASAAQSTANTASSTANIALNRATYQYGTCSTAAATAAKAVTLSGFTLYTGAMVSVRFTYGNTAAAPTLNVNGTGAKTIVSGGVSGVSSKYTWSTAYSTISFVYDGTYWRMINDEAYLKAANAQSTAQTATEGANAAKTDAAAAVSTANSAKSIAESARTTATATDKALLDLCHDANKTMIDGGKVYIDQAFANSIFAKQATIGGFNIGQNALYSAISKIGVSYASGAYLGQDGFVVAVNKDNYIELKNDEVPADLTGDGTTPACSFVVHTKYDQLLGAQTGCEHTVTAGYGGLKIEKKSTVFISTIVGAQTYTYETVFDGQSILIDGVDVIAALNSRIDALSGQLGNKQDKITFSASGNRFGVVPEILGDGVMEVGKYLDFHLTDSDTGDYAYRITATDGALSFSGNLNVSGAFVTTGARITCKPSYDKTVTYATNMYVGTSGIYSRSTNTSSRTIKHNIKELQDTEISAERLYDVGIYQFRYNADIITDQEDCRYMKDLPGFIIEDVEQHYPIAVDKPTDDVKEWSWNAQYLIPPMLKLVQEQHKADIQLSGRMDRAESQLEHSRCQLDHVMLKIAALEKEIQLLKAS